MKQLLGKRVSTKCLAWTGSILTRLAGCRDGLQWFGALSPLVTHWIFFNYADLTSIVFLYSAFSFRQAKLVNFSERKIVFFNRLFLIMKQNYAFGKVHIWYYSNPVQKAK